MTRLMRFTLALLACGLIVGARTAVAQESRGSIAGLVVDSSGGALPGVTVTIRNTGTNATVVQTTNEAGQYTAVLLLPGTYAVTVELSGFQKREYQSVQVHVGERVQLDATLGPASVSESVLVVGESPQLEAGSATIGQVINSTLISEIPLGDGTAYGLTRLIPGASFERSYALQRPMDNDNLRGMTITGTINSEFTIDGSSNIVSQARAGIQPPSDAIEEFKVETAAYDAQVGHTGAGAVNLALKTGTNQFHGSASYYNRDDSRSANLFASIRNGSGKTPRNYNRYSGAIGGPIFRNKTFFMFSYEKLQDDTIEAFGSSVPTARMRTGDFSELLSNGVQIFDPRTARLVNGVVVRDPFPGNIIPADRINPVARNVLGYFPGAESGRGGGLVPEFLRRAALDLCVQLPDGARRSRVDEQPAHLRALHPELQARGAIQLRRRDAGRRNHARRDRSLQLQLRGRAYGCALADDGVRHEGKLAALQRRSVSALYHRSGEPRVCVVHGRAVWRLPADAELRLGVWDAHHNGTRREARGPAKRLQQRTHAAVLQRPDCTDADQDRGRAYIQDWL